MPSWKHHPIDSMKCWRVILHWRSIWLLIAALMAMVAMAAAMAIIMVVVRPEVVVVRRRAPPWPRVVLV